MSGCETTFINVDIHSIPEGILETHRELDNFLGGDLFFTPAWEAILKLYIMDNEVTEDCLCAMISTFPSIVRRWIKILQHRGIISVRECSGVRHLSLSNHIRDGLERTLTATWSKFNSDRVG
jgi:hypothetical protein